MTKHRRTHPKPLRWKRTHEKDLGTSWWARSGPLQFAIYYCPPEPGQRKSRIEMTAWTADCEEPELATIQTYSGPLEQFAEDVPVYQRVIVRETAETLEAKAATVRALFS